MKIGILGLDNFSAGKDNIVDRRLDQVKDLAHSAKKTYIQAEIIIEPRRLLEADGIISVRDKQADLILGDLEFVEKRLANTQDEKERGLLGRFKQQLEGERFIYELELSPDESKAASAYALMTARPVFLCQQQEAQERGW